MNTKIETGMTVYLRPTIHNRGEIVREGTLTKIGRKYYTVKSKYSDYTFEIKTLNEVNGPYFKLYFSREDLDNDVEREEIITQMSRLFETALRNGCQVSLENLRRIAQIAEWNPQPEEDDSDNEPSNYDRYKFEQLRNHVGHNVVVVIYGGDCNVSIECEDCNEVLYSVDNPDIEWVKPDEK